MPTLVSMPLAPNLTATQRQSEAFKKQAVDAEQTADAGFSATTAQAFQHAFNKHADKNGSKRPTVTVQEDKVTVTFAKTVLFQGTVRPWYHPVRWWNWLFSRGAYFDSNEHIDKVHSALIKKYGDIIVPDVTVARSKVRLWGLSHILDLFGLSLWDRRSTPVHHLQGQSVASQPIQMSVTYTSNQLAEMVRRYREQKPECMDGDLTIQSRLLQRITVIATTSGLCWDDQQNNEITPTKRNTINPLRRLILYFVSETRWLHVWARSKELGCEEANTELDVPAIETGFVASTGNIVIGLGGVAAAGLGTAASAGVLPVATGAVGAVLATTSALPFGAQATIAVAGVVETMGGAITTYHGKCATDARNAQQGFYSKFFLNTNTRLHPIVKPTIPVVNKQVDDSEPAQTSQL